MEKILPIKLAIKQWCAKIVGNTKDNTKLLNLVLSFVCS